MNLIVFNDWTRNIEDYFIVLIPNAQVGAHLARVTAHARGCELDLCRYMPAFRIVCGGQRETAADASDCVTAGGSQQFQ